MDATVFGAEMVALVKDFLEAEIDPLRQEIAALKHQIASIPASVEPKEVDIDDVATRATERILPELKELRSAIEAIPSVPELPDIPAMISEAVSAIPVPLSGDDVKALVIEAVAAIPPAQPGKDADPEHVAAVVKAEAERILAGWDRPQDGKSVTVDEVGPILAEAVQKAVAALPVPKDGVSLAGALIDRQGGLILTLSDGSTRDLGKVVGKDAEPVDMAAVERSIVEKIAAIPVPKDGVDGVGFDDMNCEIRDDGVYLVWEKGDVIKEGRLPVPIYRGVWKEGVYHKGDTVTWGGSTWIWIAEGDPSGKPDAPESGWRLAVKKGRDGKDGVIKEQKPSGPVKVG